MIYLIFIQYKNEKRVLAYDLPFASHDLPFASYDLPICDLWSTYPSRSAEISVLGKRWILTIHHSKA